MSDKIRKQDKTKHRVTVTISDNMYTQLCYWAEKRELTINEYLGDALEAAIRHENQDYELPTMEQARLNQLIDAIAVLSSNTQSLEQIVTSGFDSLLGLTRGDNYLLEHDDGEL